MNNTTKLWIKYQRKTVTMQRWNCLQWIEKKQFFYNKLVPVLNFWSANQVNIILENNFKNTCKTISVKICHIKMKWTKNYIHNFSSLNAYTQTPQKKIINCNKCSYHLFRNLLKSYQPYYEGGVKGYVKTVY